MGLLLAEQIEGGGDGGGGQVDLSVQLDTGCVAIADAPLHLAQCGYVLDPPASVIVSQVVCPVICLPGRYSMEGDKLGLVLVVVEVVQVVETGNSYESNLSHWISF